ncbi:uncharacterized protein E0L32_011214 [Thyridium curvatum]|uniref:Peptidase M20 dimerisation domain-containing protein n=1 Tax=Thyridium curvatum TaxID=1093900 RepID=A0A507BP86_9PEZI|nr:uncharacterized protein E0L32_011214 [Thyridium curvatum]TPX19141.1 hypothetical protein E0L32_011214 [Thyridium curvatum]
MRSGHVLASACLLGGAIAATHQENAPAYRDELLSFLKDLVDIHSITGNEKQVGEFVIDYLTDLGYTAVNQTLPPTERFDNLERFNVVAWRGGDKHRPKNPRLVVSSHIDTVPPYIPYSIDDGEITSDTEIRGRGSVDDKSSLAAQVVAVEELVRNKEINAEDVMLAFVVGEEVTGDGMRAFSNLVAAMDPPLGLEAGIFGEPTVNKLACGHKGHMACTIRARGKAAHSGYPWLGKSANEVLVRAMMEIMSTEFDGSERFGNTTVNIGVLEGGVAANVVPQDAVAKLAFRIATGPQVGGQKAIIDKLDEILKRVDPEALSAECENGYGAVYCDCEVDGFETLIVNYGTDLPNFDGGEGFKKYLYGPGNIFVAHSDHEALKVGSIEKAVEDYKKLIKHVLGDSKSSVEL